ncbi:MAG: hypothetical protein WCO18_00010 [bacterium]
MNIFFHKKAIGIVIFVLFIAAFPIQSYALSLTLTPFFGGYIKKVTYCTCYYDPAVVLEIKDYSSTPSQTLKLKWSFWFSKLDANYNIWEQNIWVLGGYTKMTASCKDTSGYYCKDSGTSADGMIDRTRGIGSGLIPDPTLSASVSL